MASIEIAMPVARANVKMQATQTVIDTALALKSEDHDLRFIAAEFSDVVWAGNFLASWVLNEGADVLYFIDSDMYFPPEVSLALLAADKDVIGAIAPRRRVAASTSTGWFRSRAVTPRRARLRCWEDRSNIACEWDRRCRPLKRACPRRSESEWPSP